MSRHILYVKTKHGKPRALKQLQFYIRLGYCNNIKTFWVNTAIDSVEMVSGDQVDNIFNVALGNNYKIFKP